MKCGVEEGHMFHAQTDINLIPPVLHQDIRKVNAAADLISSLLEKKKRRGLGWKSGGRACSVTNRSLLVPRLQEHNPLIESCGCDGAGRALHPAHMPSDAMMDLVVKVKIRPQREERLGNRMETC